MNGAIIRPHIATIYIRNYTKLFPLGGSSLYRISNEPWGLSDIYSYITAFIKRQLIYIIELWRGTILINITWPFVLCHNNGHNNYISQTEQNINQLISTPFVVATVFNFHAASPNKLHFSHLST